MWIGENVDVSILTNTLKPLPGSKRDIVPHLMQGVAFECVCENMLAFAVNIEAPIYVQFECKTCKARYSVLWEENKPVEVLQKR